jgi:hypothetical protein
MLVFEPSGSLPVGAEDYWEAPEVCAEGADGCIAGAEGTAGCMVEPVGAGVNPTVKDIDKI